MARLANTVVIACGALGQELATLREMNGWSHMDFACLPAELHNRPERIAPGVEAKILALRCEYDHLFVAYGDCGTGGALDAVLQRHGVERLPGAHCYEFFAGSQAFAAFHEAEIGTFYLTDFLLRHFDRLVIQGLGLDRHPELRGLYFGHYTKLVYLAQAPQAVDAERAQRAADQLGLACEVVHTGYGELATGLAHVATHGAPHRNPTEHPITWAN